MFERIKSMVSPAHEVDAWNPRKKDHLTREESEQLVLDCLKRYEGEIVGYDEIAREVGVTQGYVSHLIASLTENKAVTRNGKRGSYTFTVNRAKARRRAYKKRKSVPVKAVASKPTVELRKPSSAKPRAAVRRNERVLEYLKKHQHEFISQAEISQGTDISQTGVSFAIRELEESGLICRSIPVPNLGTQYRIMEQDVPVTSLNSAPQHLPEARVMTHDERLIRDFLEFQRQRKV